MSAWALIGLSIALLIAGFNIGYDCRHKKIFFNRSKKYRYWISCVYDINGNSTLVGWGFDFDSEMTREQLEAFRMKQIENLKTKYNTDNVGFEIIDFKRLRD